MKSSEHSHRATSTSSSSSSSHAASSAADATPSKKRKFAATSPASVVASSPSLSSAGVASGSSGSKASASLRERKTGILSSKRKRDDASENEFKLKSEFVAYAQGSSSDVQMELLSSSENTPSEHIDLQPVDMILHIFSFLVASDDFLNMGQSILPDGSVNWINFQNLGIKNKGTEGTCFKCYQRSTGKTLAMKKARVFPKGEGVPYYMLRELAVLKGIKHDHIATLEMISLAKDELHVFFPYVDKTLHEIINPTGDPSGGRVLSERVQRITAEDALRHPYFSGFSPDHGVLVPTIPMGDMEYTLKRLRSSNIPENVELFHAYLRQTERDTWKEIKYLSRQKTLRPAHRSMLVDWLIEVVVDVFEMCLRTAFLAVNYTDRFLDIVMVKKTRFQLLGATCLHVASKCEDVSYIGVEDLAMCADNVYTSAEVLKMEEKLLNTLNFTLSVPTALDFLNIYERMIPPIQKKTSMLAHYLLELALQEYQFLRFLPSVVAACCMSMALYTVEGFPMSQELADACQYKWTDLKDCMAELQTVYSNSPSNNLAVIKKRYSKAERCQVASILPPVSFNMSF
ncbi:hypothetical protein P43SY_008226 [Pythium insidiosum]|uniref:Cyclin-F n=1 Tax=Pythium insidiosum TaxID=114742 RepID=A0AAD5Q4T8_PYTIN|nr:hypothetical protein P43SY_008226 [Pythium insidiosum]